MLRENYTFRLYGFDLNGNCIAVLTIGYINSMHSS